MKIKIYKLMPIVALVSLLSAAQNSYAQPKKLRVLFIGNSFTETNDLPNMIRNVALSAGDTLIPDKSAPGGMTLEGHTTNAITLSKINTGNWNYVVLQEQSQRPALDEADVAKDVYPFAAFLDSLVHDKNKCGRTVFFNTWAYRDGDAFNCPTYPPICTYDGMDSLLELRYRQMAIDNEGLISPVGMVFTKIRDAMPVLDLYSPDGIHPSEIGSYAAAVTFYTILFAKDPTLIKFNHTVFPIDAEMIRQIIKINVFDNLPKYFVGDYKPDADFTYSVAANTVNFNSSASVNVGNYTWDFGDGGTSTDANPAHTYAAVGTYTVRLIGDDCQRKDTTTQSVTITTTGGIQHLSVLNSIKIFPNPASTVLNFESAFSMNNIQISITNMLGATIINNVAFDNKPIQIDALAKGIYLVHIKDLQSGEVITRKFAKD